MKKKTSKLQIPMSIIYNNTFLVLMLHNTTVIWKRCKSTGLAFPTSKSVKSAAGSCNKIMNDTVPPISENTNHDNNILYVLYRCNNHHFLSIIVKTTNTQTLKFFVSLAHFSRVTLNYFWLCRSPKLLVIVVAELLQFECPC